MLYYSSLVIGWLKIKIERVTTKGKILTGFGLFVLVLTGTLGGYVLNKQSKLKHIDARQDEAEELAGELSGLRSEYKAMKALEEALNLNARNFTAISTLKAVAENIPDEVTLDSISYIQSRNPQVNNVLLRGRVSQSDAAKLGNFSKALVDAKLVQDQSKPLFKEVMPPNLDNRVGGYVNWTISCVVGEKGVGEKSSPENDSNKKHSVSISTSPIKYQRKDSAEFLTAIPREELELKIASYKKDRELLQAKLTEMTPLKAEWIKQGYPIKEEDPNGQGAQKLMMEVEASARRSGINITRARSSLGTASKNSNLMGHSRMVSFQADIITLAEFLNTISLQSPVICVNNLTASPTPDRQNLKIDITFTTSFLRNMEALKLKPVTTEKKSTQTGSLQKKIDQATQLFAKTDPFRLIKPEPEKKEVRVVPPKPSIRIPKLSGVLRINGNAKALLLISPPGGGPPQYVQVAVGELLHGVKVSKIELGKGQVQLIIQGREFNLEIDKEITGVSSATSLNKPPQRPGRLNAVPTRGRKTQP